MIYFFGDEEKQRSKRKGRIRGRERKKNNKRAEWMKKKIKK